MVCDREGTFECLELPGGRDPLLGVIPLEALGIELDLKNQKLKLLPLEPTDTYLTILPAAIAQKAPERAPERAQEKK